MPEGVRVLAVCDARVEEFEATMLRDLDDDQRLDSLAR